WNPEIEANGPLAMLQVLQQLGIERVDIPFATTIFEALRIRIPASRPLFSDTLPTLAALQQRGFLLGVVTNRLYAAEPFQEALGTLGLLDYLIRVIWRFPATWAYENPIPPSFCMPSRRSTLRLRTPPWLETH